jgi:hypothetical protein
MKRLVCVIGLAWGLSTCVATDSGPVDATSAALVARTLVSGEIIAEANGWFDATDGNRVWLANVRGDAAPELVGVDDSGQPWVGSPTAGVPSAPWGARTFFSRANQWLADPNAPHLSLADVTGDGRADLVGIAFDGTIWVSRALDEPSMRGFCPPVRVAPTSAPFPRASYFTSPFPRVSFVDLGNDGALDLVGTGRNGVVAVVRATPDAATTCTTPTMSLVALHLDGPRPLQDLLGVWTGTGYEERYVERERPSFVWAKRASGTAWLVWTDANGNVWTLDALTADDRRQIGSFRWLEESGLFSGPHDRLFAGDLDGDANEELVVVAPWPYATIDGVSPESPTGPPIRVLSLTSTHVLTESTRRGFAQAAFAQHAACFTRPTEDLRMADVTGDGAPDLVGVDFFGGLHVCESYVERSSPHAHPDHASKRFAFRASAPWVSAVPPLHLRPHARDRWVVAPIRGPGSAAELVLLDPSRDRSVVAAQVAGTRIHDVTHHWDLGAWRIAARASMPFPASWTPSCGLQVSNGTLRDAWVWGAWVYATVEPTGAAPVTAKFRENGCGETFDANGNGRVDEQGRSVWLTRAPHTFAATARISMLPDNFADLPGGGGWGFTRAQWPRTPSTTLIPGEDQLPPTIGVIVLAIPSEAPNAAHELFAIASLDAIGVNAGETLLALERTYGIAPDHVVVAATHAHSTFRVAALFDSPYFDATDLLASTTDGRAIPLARFVDEQTTAAVGGALTRMQPVDLEVGAATLDPNAGPVPGRDRAGRSPTVSGICPTNGEYCSPGSMGPCEVDPHQAVNVHPYPRLSTMRWVREGTREVVAMLVSYPMHPVSISERHFLHADYPGYLVTRAEENVCAGRPECEVLFVNGAGGDIDPTGAPRDGGHRIADVALGLHQHTHAGRTLRAHTTRFWTSVDTSFERCPAVADGRHRAVTSSPGTLWRLTANGSPVTVVGAMSGEPFIGHQIAFDRAWASTPHTMFVGYAHAYTGYHALPGEHANYGSAPCSGPMFYDRPESSSSCGPTGGCLDSYGRRGEALCRLAAAPADALVSAAR